jgi:hypothetical protein
MVNVLGRSGLYEPTRRNPHFRDKEIDLHDRTAIIRTKLVQFRWSTTITTLDLSLFYIALPSTGSNIAVPKQDNVRINVTLRRFRVTIVTVENQYVLIILGLSVVSFPAYKVHAPYYIVICGLSGSTNFFHVIS